MQTHSKILKWGNSLGIRLSGALKELTDFKVGTEVDIEIRKDGLFIKKSSHQKILPYSESELIADLNEESHRDLLTSPLRNEWHD